MRQKKGQDYPHNVNFNVSGQYQRQEGSESNLHYPKQRQQQQQQQDFIQQYQNGSNMPLQNWNYWKGAINQGMQNIASSSQLSQPSFQESQLGVPKSGAIQGRKIDSSKQVQVYAKPMLNIQSSVFYQGSQIPIQMKGIYNRENGLQNNIQQGQFFNQVHQMNGSYEQSGSTGSTSSLLKKKYSHSKEEPQIYIANYNKISHTEGHTQNSQKKKRPASSLNQNQLKTIYEDIKKTERKPRSTSNTPTKEKSSRSASKKKSLEKSQKKLSQTLDTHTNSKFNNENQENDFAFQQEKQLSGTVTLRRKKKSSNSVHIKPVSKQTQSNYPLQQHSASKSRSPGRVKKNSQHNGVSQIQGNILGEKNLNSPQKSTKVLTSTKSPDDKQKIKKKSLSKSKSKPKLSHAKSTSQLLVSYQQSHQQSIQNDQPKDQTQSTNNFKEVETFIKKNAQKIQFEQFVKKQEEIEERIKTKQEEEKRKIQNDLIRKENLQKFCKLKKANKEENSQILQSNNLNTLQLQQKYAWGTNQQRIKMHQIIQTQQNQQQQSIEKSQFNYTQFFPKGQLFNNEEELQYLQQEKEKKRREKSGLSFLNNLNESFIKKKLEFEKLKLETISKNEATDENKKKLQPPLNHEEIKKFMILKKKRIEYENKKRYDEQKERQERLKNNLQVLDQEIKNSRSNNSCWVQGSQDKDKNQIMAPTHQRSKSAQRKKKSRTVSTPNLEKFFNKSQSQANGIGENLLKKELSLKQFNIFNQNQMDNQQQSQMNGQQEFEEEAFLQNNYFSNTQQQYSKKYEPIGFYQNKNSNHQASTNNNIIGHSTDINDENFDMLNQEFKKMFNITGSYIDDKNLMEFSQSINRTWQLTTQGQANNASNRLGSSGKKGKTRQTDFAKPKSISMHASSSVGNFKMGQGFDSSHFGNIQNLQPKQPQRFKDSSKERSNSNTNLKKVRKSQVTSISPEPKIISKQNQNILKNPPQQLSTIDNLYKKLQQAQVLDVSDQTSQQTKDKYIQDLIKLKKDELKNMYNQINSRVNQIKQQVNPNDQQHKNGHQSESYNLEDNEDQANYEQKYYNQPLNNKKIQQAIQQQQQQQQQGNSNSLGSINSSQRRVHISNASPIKEEPEEEDKGHFSNNQFPPPHAKLQQNYVNSFQQIFQNNKKDNINSESSNHTNNNYPQQINSNPNDSDSNRLVHLKDLHQNFKKPALKDATIYSNTNSSNKMPSPIQSIQVNIPINPIPSVSKITPPSQSRQTPSGSLSVGTDKKKTDQIGKGNQDQNNIIITPAVNNASDYQYMSNQNFNISGQLYQSNLDIETKNENNSIIPADPNAPVSLNFKETLQSKSVLSSRVDQVNSLNNQRGLEGDLNSDADNGMITSKELQPNQEGEMPILPLNLNFQYRVQKMKKRTHNTDNEESQESTSRNKLPLPQGVVQTAAQFQQKNQGGNKENNQQNKDGLVVSVTSKTPQSTNRDDNNKSSNKNVEKEYQQFQKEEEIRLSQIKEIETQNQMSSCNIESQVFQGGNNTNPSNLPNDGVNGDGQKQYQHQKVPQHTPIEHIQQQPSNQSEEGEEIDVDYLYDLDYDQLQELKMIIFQSDPENPEIQALSEQLILYDAAATIIQKVFRGFYTRKCIAAILEYQKQQDEEEEMLYQQAEKFLEENQIEPEELLEGNPIPLALQLQNNLPYHPSDQLKEYENREIQQNYNQSQQNNEISENDFPIKIKDFQQGNKVEENTTFNRESQGDHPFLTSLSMPEQSANKDLYHQKNYNDDLLQPKESDFMPDFDFYDQPSEKSQKNNVDIYNQNIGITNNLNSIPTFLPQHPQNQLNENNKQQQNINNINTSNQQQKPKFINSNNGNSENYREQSYNQLNLKEINEQSKSLVTVKDFDTTSKDRNKGAIDSVTSQKNEESAKTLLSPNSESNFQMEITKLQEQAKIWNNMINQIVNLPDNQSQQFKDNALKILSNLQKQSEMSKQLLIDNIKLNQQIPKSPQISTDRFPLSELDNINDKQNQSSEISQQERDSISKEQISSTSANAVPIKLSQNQQLNQTNLTKNLQQVDDKKQSIGVNQKKNLQLDIEEIEANYNRQQRKEQFPQIIGEKNQVGIKQNDSKQKEDEIRKNSENTDLINQEQRVMVRALSVSSAESTELRYANIVSNNSLGPSNKVSKAKQNFLDRLNNDQILNSHSNRNSHTGNESVSSVGSSFFDKQPFKEFTSKILQKFTMPQDSVEELIKTREEAIEYKHKTQMELIHKMHERNRISPKSFERKQFELEKWVSKERENLKDVKKEIERGWEQFAQTIKQTKRDIEFMEQTKRIDTSKLLQSSEEDQLRRLLSMRSESDHSIEDIGLVERRSIEGIYQFRNNGYEDPNKIKIVDNYKPADHSTLSNHSSTNIRNRNNSDNTSQPLSARSRQLSQPNSVSKEEINLPSKEKDQMIEVLENNYSKYNPKYLNVGLQLQLAQQNQQTILDHQQQQNQQKQIDLDQDFEQSEDKLAATLDNRARKISSNGSSIHDGDEEIDQFLTAEKNKNEGNIQISQRRAFDAYGYSSDDLCDEDEFNHTDNKIYKNHNNNQNDNLEIYIDHESENIDRLDVSPIFTVSSASKQGTQDKESLKFLMGNNGSNQNEVAPTMKMESDNKYDKFKYGNKRNSQDSRFSESQPSSPLSESSKKNQDAFQTIEYDDEASSKKQSISNKISPRMGFMRGDLLQEEGIDQKINYISDQTLNYLVDDAAKGTNIKKIQDKTLENESNNSAAQVNMIQINFMEPIKARQNVYNLDDFPDVSDRTSSLETSSGIYRPITPQQNLNNQPNQNNLIQQQDENQFLKQNNNKQKNPIPSPQNSPNSKEIQSQGFAAPKTLQNNFLLDLLSSDKKDSIDEDKPNQVKQQQQLLHSTSINDEEKSQKMTTEELYQTQNSQQQLQFSDQILSTQNNLPGLECATLNFIKDYLVAFSEFIKDNFTDEFLERVNIPLGMDPQEFLKTFTITETVDNSAGEISAAPIYPIVKYIHMQRPVVSEELFAHFNDIFNRERDLSVMNEELFELERFHMRMIFDCFNEALDSMRPFGLRGKPLPWKINSNKLSSILITPDNIEKILGLAIAKVLKWGSFLCGFIPERIESPTGEIVQIEDDYLNQIKEDRLAQMLENEVIENEDKWLTYEDEETDVQLEIADDIFNFLIEEAAMQLHGLQSGNNITQALPPSPNELGDESERNFTNNYEGLSKNIFGNPNISKSNKKLGLGGGIRPTNDLGISQQQAQEKKQLQKELFLKNLQMGNKQNNQSQKDSLNSSF